MNLKTFVEQHEFCRENNTPEGCGCKGCSGEDYEDCADFMVKNSRCYAVNMMCDSAEVENDAAVKN
ncbi:MAG: hypothetical protein NKF70_00260 [Methanobacterium sp. ERen5]|nr:MAG: hypothetical protein NKF70_00260 [Methanobacterium sp. ERen5]